MKSSLSQVNLPSPLETKHCIVWGLLDASLCALPSYALSPTHSLAHSPTRYTFVWPISSTTHILVVEESAYLSFSSSGLQTLIISDVIMPSINTYTLVLLTWSLTLSLLASTIAAIPTISVKGAKFFANGQQFFIKGVSQSRDPSPPSFPFPFPFPFSFSLFFSSVPSLSSL